MSSSVMQTLGLDRAGANHALRLALSAWLAFVIAASLHVHNAYWAAMPVWVVAQSSRGLLLERAFFRIVGTLIGAAFGFGILHLTGNAYLQLALLSSVVVVSAGLTHLLRGVHSYGALMTGITVAVVILPSFISPAHSDGIAWARVECTLIGVTVVTLVMGWFTPGTRRDVFYQRVRVLAGDAVAFAAMAVDMREADVILQSERQVLKEMSDIDATASMISAGSAEGYRRQHHVDTLIAASISVMAAARAIRARVRRGETAPETLPAILRSLSARLKTGVNDRGESFPPAAIPDTTPELKRLSEAIGQLENAEKALFAESTRADARSFGRKQAYIAPQRDWSLARNTGLMAGSAVFLAGLAVCLTASPAVELAALGVCIFSMVLGSMPMPQVIAPQMLVGVVAGVILATFYRFAIQPHLQSTLMLTLSVLPFMLAGGFARASNKTAIPAIDANMCFLLTSQAGMPAVAAPEILSGAAAMLVGAGIITIGFWRLPRQFNRHALDAANAIRRDLERLIRQPVSPRHDWHSRAARQILRLMLHIGRAGKLGREAPDGLLAAFNLGHAIAGLQQQSRSPGYDENTRAQTQLALQTLVNLKDDPEKAAAHLLHLAESIEHPEIARNLEMAADALWGGKAFFLFRKT